MSKPNLKAPTPVATDADDEWYFEGYRPNWEAVTFESVQTDVICSKCGLWKSEHIFEVCAAPNFLT